jgi:hypothetical protein
MGEALGEDDLGGSHDPQPGNEPMPRDAAIRGQGSYSTPPAIIGRVASLDEWQPEVVSALPRRRVANVRSVLLFGLALAVVLAIIVLVIIDLALPPPGLLRVTTSPGLPTQILVDGQIADSRGLNWVKLAPGTHTICFTHVEGWTEPPCQTLTMTSGATSTVAGSFTQRGVLRVVTSPAVASQIKVDGNPTNDWSNWTDIPTGSHTVCFGAVANYSPPACQTATVTAGNLSTITGIFRPRRGAAGQSGVGLLRVLTSPSLPSQITITPPTGSPYIADSWGLNGLELAPGSYTVSFSHVQGYTEPFAKQVTITSGMTASVTGTFHQRGTLRVTTLPGAASTIQVDGVPRNDWSVTTEFPAGSHTVCFGAAAGFAMTPACQTAVVTAGGQTTVTGAFH